MNVPDTNGKCTMNTPITSRRRPEPRGSGAATPRVYNHLGSSLNEEELAALVQNIRHGDCQYPVIDELENGEVLMSFLWCDAPEENPLDALILSANALVDHQELEACEFEQLLPGLWSITLQVPADWIASYRITVHRGGGAPPWRRETERRAIRLAADAGGIDPLNPLVGASMNGAPVSIARGPLAPHSTVLAQPTPDLFRQGPSLGGTGPAAVNERAQDPSMTKHQLWDENCQRLRDLWVYQPPGAAENTPLMLVHDGATWVNFLNIRATLDAAISQKLIEPLHAVFIDSTNTDIRGDELPVAGGTTRSLAEQFLPWARRFLPVDDNPQRTLVTGASYGGLAAVLTVLEHPSLVALAIAQSPSLWHTDLREELAALDPSVQMLVQAGCYETEIFDSCQRTLDHLKTSSSRGQVEFQQVSGGHDWAWWNEKLLEGLARFFPGAVQLESRGANDRHCQNRQGKH